MDHECEITSLVNYPKDCKDIFPSKKEFVNYITCPSYPINKCISSFGHPCPPEPPQCHCAPFYSFTEYTITTNLWTAIPSFDVSKYKVYSFSVINHSVNDAEVRVEISPNNIHFLIDVKTELLPGGEMIVLVPKRFLKFVRLAVKSAEENKSVSLEVYLQAQC